MVVADLEEGAETMRYFIITGTSRGIGESLAKQLLDNENNHVICISRKKNQDLINISKMQNSKLNYYSFDLSQTDAIEGTLKEEVLRWGNYEDVAVYGILKKDYVLLRILN